MAPTPTTESPPLFFFFLFLLLLSHAFLSAKAQQRQIEGCLAFSCGQWHNISYPFRRRDDPPQCGEALYQLNCQGNKSTFSIGSVEYLVTDIRYNHDAWMFRLVDPNFVGGGSGGLPSKSLSPGMLKSIGFWLNFRQWAGFMNCSQPIKQTYSDYWPVFYLSNRYNSSFVYVFIANIGYELEYLHPSCELVSTIPMSDDCPEKILNSKEDVFSILHKGFILHLSQQRQTESCPPFSCGQFHNISYHLHQSDGPPQCRDAPFQLNCQGNKAILAVGSVDYLVTQIQCDSDRWNFQVVDPNFVGGRSCGLPAQSLSPNTLRRLELWPDTRSWASFMNCSQPIKQKDSGYWPVSCLSSRYTSSFVYVFIAYDGYELRYLPPSCQFISMIPVTYYNYPGMILNSTEDVFSILQLGFDLNNYNLFGISKGTEFRECLKQATRLFFHQIRRTKFTSKISSLENTNHEFFLYCVKGYLDHNFNFRISKAVVTFMQIVQHLILLLILGRFVVIPIMIWFFVAYKLWSTQREIAIDTVEKFLRHQQMLTPTRYAYTDIIAITRHFKEKLGQGGFGSVFKGELAGGILVAVKMMESSKCNGDEFINEVSTIGRIHHVNVVRLVGFCSDGSKRALVYEYMSNGSLDKYIFTNRNGTNLHAFTSEKLTNIAMGIARGINYLHCGCDMQILHFDIKPHNILLDHNFTPKISDFGLARLYPKDNSLVSISATRGTIGYIAPELISRSFGVISKKSDVYSYGMLLMEMAGRRRNVDPLVENSSQVYYPSWIYDKLNQQQEIILENNFEISELEKKLATIGLWCIQMKSFNRPTMTQVIEMLESNIETIPMPPKPFLSSMDSIVENKTCLVSFSTELSIVSE